MIFCHHDKLPFFGVLCIICMPKTLMCLRFFSAMLGFHGDVYSLWVVVGRARVYWCQSAVVSVSVPPVTHWVHIRTIFPLSSLWCPWKWPTFWQFAVSSTAKVDQALPSLPTYGFEQPSLMLLVMCNMTVSSVFSLQLWWWK